MWVLFIFEKFDQNIKSESSETCTIEEPQRLVIADKRNYHEKVYLFWTKVHIGLR